MNAINSGRTRWVGRGLCAALTVVGAVAFAQPAQAYHLKKDGACTEIRWSSPSPNPEYKIHIYEFFDGGGDATDLTALDAAVYDVMREFNNVGGTTATVDTSGITNDARAYESGTPFNDTTPTIHIGFTDDPFEVDNKGNAPASAKFSVDQATCTYDEVRITFRDLSLTSWNFGTPGAVPEPYYSTADTDRAGNLWFRPIMLHELLHAFGLTHSDDSYSFMNYFAFPWAGGGVAQSAAIRPLPDDVRALRYLYPGTSSRSEVALLTTWYDDSLLSGGSAAQVHLCAPSLGDKAITGPFGGYYCGTGGPKAGSTTVCAGDRLYTQFVLANYSTEKVSTVGLSMYLSTDDVYSTTDLLSPTSAAITVEAAHSKLDRHAWDVPSGLTSGTKYNVIIRASGTTTSGAAVDDWTPLTAPVTAC
jgi:hypothetical protein